MNKTRKFSDIDQFGDFQTPISLARRVCLLVKESGFDPASIIEPSCGLGAFLQASLETFPRAKSIFGLEINPRYVKLAGEKIRSFLCPEKSIKIRSGDFFHFNWRDILRNMPAPLLVLGNPPWITSAELGRISGWNIPPKENSDRLRGIDAITGKSNFDVSEWMLRENVKWITEKGGVLAVLCKTSVARKVLAYAWKNSLPLSCASLFHIDTRSLFGAAVDACLLLASSLSPQAGENTCRVYDSLEATSSSGEFGWDNKQLIANVSLYRQWSFLSAKGLKGWRSGIKHDASKIFELQRRQGKWVNGFDETVDVEPEVVYPLLKSADLSKGHSPKHWLIIPQKNMQENTANLRKKAPKAWSYLNDHASVLNSRKSSIYRNRPPFSIFGVGPYTFAPWKVAIAGLYKKLRFRVVSSFQGKPVVFDDTCYFFPCRSEEECSLLCDLLTSKPAQEFLESLIFWDAKRPITASVLNRLDIHALACTLGKQCALANELAKRQTVDYQEIENQLSLFPEN